MTRLSGVRPVFVAIPVILLFFWLATNSLVGDSPTMDEQNHLARGLVLLHTGDPRFSLEHPPLINVLDALPLLTLPELQLPLDHPSWGQREGWYAFAEQLLWVYNQDVERMVFLSRLPTLYLTLGLALVGFRFSRQLWGRLGAMLALVFLLFDPNILAHGRYTTTDVGGTAMVLLSAYMLWRLWSGDRWNWGRLVAGGIALGLAFASKFSNLIFVPVFALLAILPLYGHGWRWASALRRLFKYLVAGAISVFVLWGVYAFEWRPYRFISTPFTNLNQFSGPLPTFLAGIEQILSVSEGGRPAFLMGEFSIDGWWYYFPVAFTIKTPILVLLLFLIAAILLLSRNETRRRAAYLLIPAVGFFIISMLSALNIGYRHLLPILPFLYVMASGLIVVPGIAGNATRMRHYIARYTLLAALISVFVIDILIHPHYLSYFNLFVGGPANGHKYLVDSNLDWGQDLLRLKAWMADNDVDQLKLSWFGTADPAYYGIDYDPLPGLTHHFDLWWDLPFDPDEPEPGIYAISASNLWEIPLADKKVFPWFRARQPDDRIGYSIFIYVVEEDDVAIQ